MPTDSTLNCVETQLTSVAPGLAPSSQTGVRELSPKAHVTGLELQHTKAKALVTPLQITNRHSSSVTVGIVSGTVTGITSWGKLNIELPGAAGACGWRLPSWPQSCFLTLYPPHR